MATTSYSWILRHPSQFQINSHNIPAEITSPAIAGNAAGTYAVAWTSTTVTTGVAGRVLEQNATGPAQFSVGLPGSFLQYDPSVAALADGRFIITYTDTQDDPGGDVRARLIDGGPSSHIDVATTSHNDDQASVAALADGGYAVTWTRHLGAGNNDILVTIYNSNNSVRSELVGVSTNANSSSQSSVAGLAGGGFVVAWEESPAAGGDTEVRFRRFNADGTPVDPASVLIDTAGSINRDIQIKGLPDGGFVVAYEDNQWGTGSDITARIYNGDGTASNLIQVNSTGGDQVSPTLAVMPNGYFAVGWLSEPSTRAVYRLCDNLGNSIVGQSDISDATGVAIATVGDRMVIAYSNPLDADGSEVEILQYEPVRIITGTDSFDYLSGNDDSIRERIFGGDGDDGFYGSIGPDEFDGGPGVDWMHYDNAAAGVVASLGWSGDNAGPAAGHEYHRIENLIGSSYDDTLEGDSNSNILIGGTGDDVLRGGGVFVDTMYGGAGNDTYDVYGPDILIEHAGGGIDTVNSPDSYRLGTDIENLNLLLNTGAANGTGNELANVITGKGANNILDGAGGNDTLTGGRGDDTLIGGDGNDTAVFSGNFNDHVVMELGSKFAVIGPDGSDMLTGIEHLQFADTTITPANLADGNPLFDTLYYLSRNADVFHAGVNALEHFNTHGRHEGRDPNAYFDTSGYLAVNKEVAASGANPLEHYRYSGSQEGCDPSASFDTTLYLINNPDVAALGLDPLAHYLANGFAEGRSAYAAIGQNIAGGFDAQYYLFHNPDVAAAGFDPLFHFNAAGWQEGRDPNAWFDADGYLAHYADVAAAGINPLQHYETVGWKEGRDASAGFDTLGYLAANPDVAAANYNPLDHFLQHGIYEGRTAVNDGIWH